jgi:hypothetical protein
MTDTPAAPTTQADRLRLLLLEADIRWPDEHTRLSGEMIAEKFDAALAEARSTPAEALLPRCPECGFMGRKGVWHAEDCPRDEPSRWRSTPAEALDEDLLMLALDWAGVRDSELIAKNAAEEYRRLARLRSPESDR